MKNQALLLAVIVVALLACKKKQPDPTPVPVATATTAAPEAAADTWTKFKSDGGKFELVTPSSMKEESNATETAAGELDMHMFTAKHESCTYQIAYTDMPSKIVKAAGAQKLLKGGEEGAMKAINAKDVSSKQIKLDGHPGREFSTIAEVEGIELDYFGRVYMVKNRLYQLQVIGPKGQVSETDRDKFIESFKLVED